MLVISRLIAGLVVDVVRLSDTQSLRATRLQSMKWLTEYFGAQAMITSAFKLRWRLSAAGVNLRQEVSIASKYWQCTFVVREKTVSSSYDGIVEIISPSAFTFKIPFH